MKKLLAANLLLMGIIIYLVMQVGKTELYLPEFYSYGQNPVSFHWNYIDIETGSRLYPPNLDHSVIPRFAGSFRSDDCRFYQKEIRE
ncbi:hypothetical protein ACWYID_10710 [Bacillus rugosus]